MKYIQQTTRLFLCFFASIAVFVSYSTLTAQDRDQTKQNRSTSRSQMLEELNQTRIAPDFDDQSLQSVVDWLTGKNVNFPVVIGKSVNPDQTISIKINNPISVKRFLKLIMQQHELDAQYKHGSLVLVQKGAGESLQRRLYDVRDLLHSLHDFKGPKLMLTDPDTKEGGGPGGNSEGFIGAETFSSDLDEKQNPIGDREELMNTIRENTGTKEAWSENGRMKIQNGILIVKQSPSVQRDILSLINRLRQFK